MLVAEVASQVWLVRTAREGETRHERIEMERNWDYVCTMKRPLLG